MSVATQLPARPLTLDDVTRIAEADDLHRFELSEGNLIVMPPPTWRHQEICGLLFAWLVAGGYRGRVNIAPGLRTATDDRNGRIPDVVVTTGPMPPDAVWLPSESVVLAVEVVSPGSERLDRWFKPVEYAKAGIKRYWRVEPDGTVVQFHLDADSYTQVGAVALDDLLAGDVPGLS